MLAPAQETFRGNRIAMALFGLLAWLCTFFAYTATPVWGPRATTQQFVLLAMAGCLAVCFAWMYWLRVSLHPDGISKRSLLGSQEMRWDEVDRFYYSAWREMGYIFSPPKPTYHFKLVNHRGESLRLGSSLGRAAELGQKLIRHTLQPLLDKAAHLFDSGAELDFGAIRVGRSSGIEVQRLFKKKRIPLDQVFSYEISEGHFYIFQVGEKRATGPLISQVPNAFVLLALLDAIYQKRT